MVRRRGSLSAASTWSSRRSARSGSGSTEVASAYGSSAGVTAFGVVVGLAAVAGGLLVVVRSRAALTT
ncbi:hypothetical protein U3653_26035 [Nocardia sp. CDC186]|uniref:LPXTG cell wall anchor domain-containing protein n=1 Tax=Nocardia implantans TaxID=3108168 RepID=A0ABU6B1E2_9NOCA|nr:MULTISPECIES: hypothetical protein [unclassified Nocardia]MBF6195625.1 hypothetical protein [Nocardia beijingensis]MEA3531289.1 hypothetical protein [Nocardia sp. CDC192]MEB3513501.1 hypothetical protein [Nocardia sp. CDC186]